MNISENRQITRNYKLTNPAGEKKSSVLPRVTIANQEYAYLLEMCSPKQDVITLESSAENQETGTSAGYDEVIWRVLTQISCRHG